MFSRGHHGPGRDCRLLIIVFQASVTALIPLYAIGVFLSFTLSQTGMARRWWKVGPPGSRPGGDASRARRCATRRAGDIKMVINAFGAVCTAVVMLVFAVTKFRDGAWIVVFLTPALVFVFFRIHHHYKNLARQLSLENFSASAAFTRCATASSCRSAACTGGRWRPCVTRGSLSDDVTAVHVSVGRRRGRRRSRRKWETWGEGTSGWSSSTRPTG